MLPSNKRLSRPLFTKFLVSRDTKTVFNNLGTLKYENSSENRASVVVSSKIEKRAVFRNKLKRQAYSLFASVFKDDNPKHYVLYVSKKSAKIKLGELKDLFYELIKKTTK